MKHQDYYEAIERIKFDTTRVVPKGSKINNRTVALEAGRDPSSIRKDRGMDDLIAFIKSSSEPLKKKRQADKAEKLKAKIEDLQDMLDISHAKYLASMHVLLENNLFSDEKPPTKVLDFPERDNASRPVLDRAKEYRDIDK